MDELNCMSFIIDCWDFPSLFIIKDMVVSKQNNSLILRIVYAYTCYLCVLIVSKQESRTWMMFLETKSQQQYFILYTQVYSTNEAQIRLPKSTNHHYIESCTYHMVNYHDLLISLKLTISIFLQNFIKMAINAIMTLSNTKESNHRKIKTYTIYFSLQNF